MIHNALKDVEAAFSAKQKDIALAKQLAKETGLGRESLYKALSPGAKPRFDTVMRVMQGLGIHLTAH